MTQTKAADDGDPFQQFLVRHYVAIRETKHDKRAWRDSRRGIMREISHTHNLHLALREVHKSYGKLLRCDGPQSTEFCLYLSQELKASKYAVNDSSPFANSVVSQAIAQILVPVFAAEYLNFPMGRHRTMTHTMAVAALQLFAEHEARPIWVYAQLSDRLNSPSDVRRLLGTQHLPAKLRNLVLKLLGDSIVLPAESFLAQVLLNYSHCRNTDLCVAALRRQTPMVAFGGSLLLLCRDKNEAADALIMIQDCARNGDEWESIGIGPPGVRGLSVDLRQRALSVLGYDLSMTEDNTLEATIATTSWSNLDKLLTHALAQEATPDQCRVIIGEWILQRRPAWELTDPQTLALRIEHRARRVLGDGFELPLTLVQEACEEAAKRWHQVKDWQKARISERKLYLEYIKKIPTVALGSIQSQARPQRKTRPSQDAYGSSASRRLTKRPQRVSHRDSPQRRLDEMQDQIALTGQSGIR